MTAAFDYASAVAAARRAYCREAPTLTVLDPWADFLRGQDGNICSQNGEDGLLAALFARVGTRNRWCFEVGAADGVHLSNTWVLRRAGWRALLIEADEHQFNRAFLHTSAAVQVCRATVTADNLDGLLDSAVAPPDPDLGVIDVDGPDLEVWRGLARHRPRVTLVEYNVGGDGVLSGLGVWQAGLSSLLAEAKAKRYRPLATAAHNLLLASEEAC